MSLENNISCSHCRLEFDKSVMIQDNTNYFCCNGCRSVFHLLENNNLDSFYAKLGSTTLEPPTKKYNSSIKFNSKSFYEKYVTLNDDGFCEVSLIIEGIHCSACVWLNEKALHRLDGVVEVNINFTNNKALIVWHDDIIKLSFIVDMIRAIGYNAIVYDAKTQEIRINKQRKDYYLRMAVAIFASMNIMWIAVAQYAGYFSGISQDIKTVLNIAEGLLATPVLFYSGWIFFKGAYYGFKNKIVNMDLLVATGASLTYIYSIYITSLESGEAYFDSVAMIITFVLIGKFLEILSKKSASDSLDSLSLDIPSEAKVLKNNKISYCKIEDIKTEEIILISSGEKLLFDGTLLDGEGFFDESSMSGESTPIYKKIGDKVTAGTISINTDAKIEVKKDFKHSSISNLISLLENAMNKKPKIQELANHLSEYFSSIILTLSLFTFVFWYFIFGNFEESFIVGISVIIIACPCALALATPIATLIGISIGSKKSIIFKEASHLETMAKADVLVLDKTGTLTFGKPEVIKEIVFHKYDIQLLYSFVSYSKHPVSKGVLDFINLKILKLDCLVLNKFAQTSSDGITAFYKSHKLLGGNKKFMQDNGIQVNYISEKSEFYFAIDNILVCIYELEDKIKDGADSLLQYTKKHSIETIILSGDNKNVSARVAKSLKIDKYLFSQTPKTKTDFINKLHLDGKIVVMVGDGINDALALANADIGIAMGSGSDISIEVSDVVLLNSSLNSLEEAFKISRATYFLIKQNLGISLFYNAITIPLAMGGYVIPLIAAISMSISSLLVVGNSIRIRYIWERK